MEDVEKLLKTSMEEIERVLSTKTVVGDMIKIGDVTIIPLVEEVVKARYLLVMQKVRAKVVELVRVAVAVLNRLP